MDRDQATLGLFDAPEPERIVSPEDRELLPWVSMAEALGWGMTVRPSVTVAGSAGKRWGAKPLGSGSGGQRVLDQAREDGDWQPADRVGFPRRADSCDAVQIDGTEYRDRDLRQASQPAFALTEKTRSWIRFRSNDRANATERGADESAPTITGGHDFNDRQWVVDTGNTRGGTRAEGRARPTDEPAPVVTSRADQMEWREEQPDTSPHDDNPDSPGRMEGAVRVSIAEALVLQSFPPDYPVQGTKTKQFEQVGNAVPPLLALHALAGAIGLTIAPAPAGEGTSSGMVVEYRRGGERLTESTSADAPAPTVTTRTDRWQVKPEQAA